MVDLFLQWCERFLVVDNDAIRHLQNHGFDCTADGWSFTLPQLHAFLITQLACDEPPPYSLFRQQLFNSPINTHLAAHQAEIVIADNTGKVDLSTYRLVRRPA